MAKLLWDEERWLASAENWIDEQLEQADLVRAGDLDQFHVRPWSTVYRVPLRDGEAYFKALPDLLRQEVPLLVALNQWTPQAVPRLLAAAPERGWMLLQDGGELLRSWLMRENDPSAWRSVLDRYAALQQELTPQRDELLAMGVPDRRPGRLPELLAAMLEDEEDLHLDHRDGIKPETVEQLLSRFEQFVEICDELEAGPIPATLEHGDLHDANVFWGPAGPVLFDWGDCSFSHPFGSLRTVGVSLENTFGWGEDDPRIEAFFSYYLESWAAQASRPACERCLRLALVVAPFVAALRWQAALRTLPPGDESYIEPMPRLLEEMLTNLQHANAV